jgi:hypothetical protein
MKRRVLAICLLVFLAILSFGSINPIQGAPGEGDWITNYRVENPTTGLLMLEVDFKTGETRTISPIFAGAELKLTFTVDVSVTSPNTILSLRTTLQRSAIEDVYWRVVSQDQDFVGYNPADQRVQFYHQQGKLVMTLFGRIPITAVRDIPVNYTLVTLFGPAGETLDYVRVTVVTAAISEYEAVLLQKEEKLLALKNSGVASGYIELYENVLNESKVQANLGNVDSAIAILNTLSVSNEPTSAFVESLFLPVVGGLVAVSAVFGFMFIRGRGKLQYVLLVLEDQIRDLEGLTLRASKVDRTISSSLEGVKDRLKSIVGM